MKKLISLLLVLVLSLGMLSGISLAADAPAECTEAKAVVKATCEGSSDVHYFSTLNEEVVNWVQQNMLTGMRTITFLKDIVSEPTTGNDFINLGSATADWGKKNYHMLTFDLNGHTWSYTGPQNLIYSLRYGCTLTNGTIRYRDTDEKGSHFLFATGVYKGAVRASAAFDPKFMLDNLTIIDTSNGTGTSHSMLRTFNYEADYTIQNSTVYVENGNVVTLFKGTQEEATTSAGEPLIYEGEFNSRLNLKNSAIYVPNGALVATSKETPETAAVNVEDVLVVGNLKAKTCNATIYGDPTVTEGYATTVDGKPVAGNAYVYGDAPGFKIELPFTDVKEGDWYFDFVAELYGKKIVSGQTATTFNPNGNLTYAAALKLLVVGLTGTDVGNASSGHWASNYLAEAAAAGWTTIDASKLDAPITREAFCEIAAAAAGLNDPAENPFKDTTNTAVLSLVKAGVISGMSADTFQPAGILTRAQISKIISLLLKL